MAVMQSIRARLFQLWAEYVTTSLDEHRGDPARSALPTTLLLTVGAAALTGLHFTKNPAPRWWLDNLLIGDRELTALVWWGSMNLLWYVVPALIAIRFVLRRPMSGFGLTSGAVKSHLGLYIAMLAVMIPIVVAVSFTEQFQAVYPFYREALADGASWRLMVWWIVYAVQFVSLEFFFRGFLVHGLRPHLGFASIAVMMVPYTMIHFSKPPLEASAAILAGLILGALSLRTRSIWLGAMLHITVAAAMDISALIQAGAL